MIFMLLLYPINLELEEVIIEYKMLINYMSGLIHIIYKGCFIDILLCSLLQIFKQKDLEWVKFKKTQYWHV